VGISGDDVEEEGCGDVGGQYRERSDVPQKDWRGGEGMEGTCQMEGILGDEWCCCSGLVMGFLLDECQGSSTLALSFLQVGFISSACWRYHSLLVRPDGPVTRCAGPCGFIHFNDCRLVHRRTSE
jgi:hypothetical protein